MSKLVTVYCAGNACKMTQKDFIKCKEALYKIDVLCWNMSWGSSARTLENKNLMIEKIIMVKDIIEKSEKDEKRVLDMQDYNMMFSSPKPETPYVDEREMITKHIMETYK